MQRQDRLGNLLERKQVTGLSSTPTSAEQEHVFGAYADPKALKKRTTKTLQNGGIKASSGNETDEKTPAPEQEMAEQYAVPTPAQESPSRPLFLSENTEAPKGENTPAQPNNTKENFDVFKRPNWVPKHWESKPAKKGNGMRYYNPDNKHDHVRIMDEDPAGTLAYRQKPFVKRARNGTYVDKNGKPIHSKMPEAHIPYEEFNYDKTS